MLENDLLELDEILKPLQSSYTQSGKAAGEPMGETKGTAGDDTKTEEEDTKEDTEKEDIYTYRLDVANWEFEVSELGV